MNCEASAINLSPAPGLGHRKRRDVGGVRTSGSYVFQGRQRDDFLALCFRMRGDDKSGEGASEISGLQETLLQSLRHFVIKVFRSNFGRNGRNEIGVQTRVIALRKSSSLSMNTAR